MSADDFRVCSGCDEIRYKDDLEDECEKCNRKYCERCMTCGEEIFVHYVDGDFCMDCDPHDPGNLKYDDTRVLQWVIETYVNKGVQSDLDIFKLRDIYNDANLHVKPVPCAECKQTDTGCKHIANHRHNGLIGHCCVCRTGEPCEKKKSKCSQTTL